MQPLGDGWWLKRPKEEGADIPALERLIGQSAYRGRQQYLAKKKGTSVPRSKRQNTSASSAVTNLNLGKREIPTHTRVSERVQSRPPSSNIMVEKDYKG